MQLYISSVDNDLMFDDVDEIKACARQEGYSLPKKENIWT